MTPSEHPPAMSAVLFPSHGQRLIGSILMAEGAGPHPTLVILHGLPGYERNGDLAHEVRRAGWNVLVFSYRGSWGSEGSFSITNCIEDAGSALDFLRGPKACDLRVDRERLVLAGASLGGFVALHSAAQDPAVLGTASIAGFDFGAVALARADDVGSREEAVASLGEASLAPLTGTSAAAIVDEVAYRAMDWQLSRTVPALKDRHVLLLGGSRDTVAPLDVHFDPLVGEFERVGTRHFEHAVLEGDHNFSESRTDLAQHLIAWLSEVRGAGQ